MSRLSAKFTVRYNTNYAISTHKQKCKNEFLNSQITLFYKDDFFSHNINISILFATGAAIATPVHYTKKRER